MDPQFISPTPPQDNIAPQAPTPAPVPINPSEPQPLFAPDIPLQAPKKPKKGKALIVILILLLLATAAGGAYYYFMVMQKDTNNQATVQTDPAPEPAEAPAKTCLAAADYDSIYKEVSGTARPETATYKEESYSQELSFNPDSTDFSAPISTSEGVVTAFATFTKANSANKEFKITIIGYYANDKQTEKDLATKRAEKVKELLVKKGADAELIVVKDPQLVAAITSPTPATDTTAVTTAKTVKVTIDPTCSSAPTETTPAPATPSQ